MADLVLVHGGSHGAWCWERLLPELAARGHSGLPVDVRMDDPALDLEACASSVAEQCAHLRSPVVVGHSIAGTFLPLVAQRTSARLMVFLCAMVPVEGSSLADQQAADADMVRFPYALVADAQGRTLATREVARAMYYSDCSEADVDAAVARLRPQAPTVRRTPFPRGGWPDVPAVSIVATDDAVVSPEWGRRVARERLGVDAVELPGDHSPMISRPAELAGVLDALVRAADAGR